MTKLVTAFWSAKLNAITGSGELGNRVSEENLDLALELMVVGVHYAQALARIQGGDASIECDPQEKAPGYLRLRVSEGFVFGCDPGRYPVDRFLDDLHTQFAMSFLSDHTARVLAAGATYSFYPYFICGFRPLPYGPNAFLLARSISFLAMFVFWKEFDGNLSAALDYARHLSQRNDSRRLLDKEPIHYRLVAGTEGEKRAHTLQVIGDAVEKVLLQNAERLQKIGGFSAAATHGAGR